MLDPEGRYAVRPALMAADAPPSTGFTTDAPACETGIGGRALGGCGHGGLPNSIT